MSLIQNAVKDGKQVILTDVQRGEAGLTCCTCGNKLVVKDGSGQFSTGNGRLNVRKRKHFSHTANSDCHGEGPAHYRLKIVLREMINWALENPDEVKGVFTEASNIAVLTRNTTWNVL